MPDAIVPPAPPAAPAALDATAVAALVKDAVTQQFSQLPGMIKRITLESLTEHKPAPVPNDPNPKPAPKEIPAEIATELATLRNQNAEYATAHKTLVSNLETQANEQATRAALGKHKWVDIAEPLGALLPQVKKAANGAFVVPTVKPIQGTNLTETVDVPLEQAVADLAGKKKHWLEFTQAGSGTGASGSDGGQRDFSNKPTYEQLMQDPRLLVDWSKHDPNYVEQVSAAAIAAQRASIHKQR